MEILRKACDRMCKTSDSEIIFPAGKGGAEEKGRPDGSTGRERVRHKPQFAPAPSVRPDAVGVVQGFSGLDFWTLLRETETAFPKKLARFKRDAPGPLI